MSEIIQYSANDPNTTNALATVASVVIAFFALITSIASVVLALRSLSAQRSHSYSSVRPLAYISFADYEDRISVKIHNNGVGPLIISKLVVSGSHDAKDNLIEWMPELPSGRLWDTFVREFPGRSLAPGREIILLQLRGDVEDSGFREARELCRTALKALKVTLHYTDIYERSMPPAQRSLSWFGRTK